MFCSLYLKDNWQRKGLERDLEKVCYVIRKLISSIVAQMGACVFLLAREPRL